MESSAIYMTVLATSEATQYCCDTKSFGFVEKLYRNIIRDLKFLSSLFFKTIIKFSYLTLCDKFIRKHESVIGSTLLINLKDGLHR